MRTNIRSAALLALLAAAGCSAIVDPEKNDPLKTAEGFCNSVQDVIDRLGCDVYGMSVGARGDPTAMDQLLTQLRSSCDNLKVAVDAGRFVYDQGAAQGCIDTLEGVGCKGIFAGMVGGPAFPAACARVVKGNVAPGGACTAWNTYQGATGFSLNECTQGSTCRYADGNVCQSTCGFDADVGEACGRGNLGWCKSGLYCNLNDYKCYAYLGAGATCSGSYQYCDGSYTYCNGSTCQALPYAGQPAAAYPYCQSSAYCPSPCTPGVTLCASRNYPGSGVSCSSVPCRQDTYCNSSTDRCEYYSVEGGSCAPGYQCGWPPYTPVNLYCDSTQTCRRYPTARLGQGGDCYGLYSGYCADGLFCDSSNVTGQGAYTCQPTMPAGSVCTGAYDGCAPGAECRYVPAEAREVCTALVPLGSACDTYNGPQCLPGTWCKSATGYGPGICSPYPGPGETCANSGMACARGSYPVWGTTCVCNALLGEGAPCTNDSECGYQTNGTKCIAGFCQPFACFTPLGWLGGTSGGGT